MTNIPKWLYAYAGLMAVAPIVFSIMALLKPEALWPDVASISGALALAGPFGLYLSRNVATGLVTGFALFKKSASMLTVVLVLRLITDVIDFTLLYALKGQFIPFLFIWIIVFWGPTIWGLKALAKK